MNSSSTNDIADDIKEILSQTGSVIIPYFGRFTAQYKSASIDNIQGQLYAPSFDVSFDSSVRINDGVLVDKISRTQNIKIQEAQTKLNDYLNQANELLSQNEPFTVNGIGKIYQDSFGKIQFTSFNKNINPDSFGLPTVTFNPVSRTQTLKTTIQEPATVKTDSGIENKPTESNNFSATTTATTAQNIYITSGVEEEEKIFGMERTAFWRTFITSSLVLATLTILGLTQINKNKDKIAEKNAATEVSTSSVPATSTLNTKGVENTTRPTTDNVVLTDSSTSFTGNSTNTSAKAAVKSPNVAVESTEKKPPVAKDIAVEAKKTAKENSATIVIGGFGNANNIAKLRKWITQHGYEVYEHPKGDLKIMGAVVHYDSKEELNKITKFFKERYGYEIEVKKN